MAFDTRHKKTNIQAVEVNAGTWRQNLAGGLAITGTLILALIAYHAGVQGTALDWPTLILAVAGGVLGVIIRAGILGNFPSLTESCTDILVTGVLAASAAPVDVFVAPVNWTDLSRLAPITAASLILLYHGINIGRSFHNHRSMTLASSLILVLIPFLLGGLLVLAAPKLLSQIGGAFWGRILILSLFLTILASIFTSLLKHRLPAVRLVAVIILTSVAAVGAAWIADFGAGPFPAHWPQPARTAATIVSVMLAQAGLWGMVYLMTGMVLDALRGTPPAWRSGLSSVVNGIKRGAVYSGVFISLLLAMKAMAANGWISGLFVSHPLAMASLTGMLLFPLIKTLVETFEGSNAFFPRLKAAFSDSTLWLRGMVAGLGFSWAIMAKFPAEPTGIRALAGFVIGALSYGGVTLLRDALLAWDGQGRRTPWRTALMEHLLGGAIGAAVGFYLDANQIGIVLQRFAAYQAIAQTPAPVIVYPLLNKWGLITLGQITGGANRFFYESVTGVIVWAIPAWLFALNATFMRAAFQHEAGPIRHLFSRDGFRLLGENMIFVLRWGLWMAPIINTFLRPMGTPTWYNQDGAIRTVLATIQEVRLSPDNFHAWSLGLFTSLLSYDIVRILIWLDHMGLRVATLVNLSFIGVDRLETRLARALAPWSTGRCIPEAVKRFATWAPLLIPYYIPMGSDWDIAWSGYEAHKAKASVSLIDMLYRQPWTLQLALAAAVMTLIIVVLCLVRRCRAPSVATEKMPQLILSNPIYEVLLSRNGSLASRSIERGRQLTRQAYDPLDPAGRLLFLVDTETVATDPARSWPILGNFPATRASRLSLEQTNRGLNIRQEHNGIRSTLEITLPDTVGKTELWTLTLVNTDYRERSLNVIPYFEWVLSTADADRGHTQYNRLFTELEYSTTRQTLTAWNASSGLSGFLACNTAPTGFLTARIDFLGRARSVWHSRVFETLSFSPPMDTALHPTFDPIGSLCVPITLAAGESRTIKFLTGMSDSRPLAAAQVTRHLGLPTVEAAPPASATSTHPVRHGEIPPGTPQPYYTFLDEGKTLRVHTPFTPRPYDHTMANQSGQVTIVTNRGLHSSANGNSQQNRLTPDWADTVTRETPSEAFYLFDPATREWFSPTYHPLNDARAAYEADFGVDGTAVFRMKKDGLETELTVFVPPEASLTTYLLTIRNQRDQVRRLRVAPFFQITLADQPEHAGPLDIRRDISTGALLFDNYANNFRRGPAFAAFSAASATPEIHRSHFLGISHDVARPAMVEQGSAATHLPDDGRPIAAYLATVDIPAKGEISVCFVLGQADNPMDAATLVRNHCSVYLARKALATTRAWWLKFTASRKTPTTRQDFNEFLPWLGYQALAERIWARRGFYQTSGAYGFRDQLQDAINLIWADPAIARRQILLHAAQQFIEGDVVHWFHDLPGHRTGMAARTHASDNLLWLVWATAEYVRMTDDTSILHARTPYLEAEQPFPPLPAGKEGMGFVPLRSARQDTVYQHCLKALDRVLDEKMGTHGLPLMGTGDWNDGLDCIGSQGRGESVWLGFFLDVVLTGFTNIIEQEEGTQRASHYRQKQDALRGSLENCWRDDRYLRAIHDDGTEIGVKGSGVWEIDALTVAWAVISGINPERGRTGFDTALSILEQDKTILLGWPALRTDTKPYLGRSSRYPEGVRENGMYCHGVQWLVGAARILAEQAEARNDTQTAQHYRDTAWRLWHKIAPLSHTTPDEIEIYGGQPNKQAADLLTAYDPGRIVWHGYTGAAGWMLRQAIEGVLGVHMNRGRIQIPSDWSAPRGPLTTFQRKK